MKPALVKSGLESLSFRDKLGLEEFSVILELGQYSILYSVGCCVWFGGAHQVRLVPEGFIDLQDRCSSCIMDVKTRKVSGAPVDEGHKLEYHHHHQRHIKTTEYRRTLSHGRGSGRRLLPASYFSLESLLLLICLTATLLILPLMLPPLPPPPFMLLLLPIGILAVLMILAFMPPNVRDLTYTYV